MFSRMAKVKMLGNTNVIQDVDGTKNSHESISGWLMALKTVTFPLALSIHVT